MIRKIPELRAFYQQGYITRTIYFKSKIDSVEDF